VCYTIYTVKKATITSKCGKKVEVYYFSDHPTNKITGTAGVDDIKIENVELPNKSFSKLTVTEELYNQAWIAASDEQELEAYSELGASAGDEIEVSAQKVHPVAPMLGNLIKFNSFSGPETLQLDDSIEADAVPVEDLEEGHLYKIKGLNIVAEYEGGHTHRRFNFHGFRFWVEEDLILKSSSLDRNKYNDYKHIGGNK